jgi:hypothetical protein
LENEFNLKKILLTIVAKAIKHREINLPRSVLGVANSLKNCTGDHKNLPYREHLDSTQEGKRNSVGTSILLGLSYQLICVPIKIPKAVSPNP